jgi:hypothetical protein
VIFVFSFFLNTAFQVDVKSAAAAAPVRASQSVVKDAPKGKSQFELELEAMGLGSRSNQVCQLWPSDDVR